MAWDVYIAVLLLVLGIIYGYTRPGKENRGAILKKALVIGLVVGVIVGLAIAFLAPGTSLIGATLGATIGILIVVIALTIFFIVGTVIGDWLEARKKPQEGQTEKK